MHLFIQFTKTYLNSSIKNVEIYFPQNFLEISNNITF